MSPRPSKANNGSRVLYISYNGALEEIVPSQVIPYLRELTKERYEFTLLTFEKRQGVREKGQKGLRRLKRELKAMGIDWYWLCYHKRLSLLATSFDVLVGTVYTVYLVVARKIRIIHARSIIPAAMSLVPRLFGAKFIFDTRGLLAEEYVGGGHWKEGGMKYRITKFFERLCLGLSDAIVVLTRQHLEHLLALPWLKDKSPARPIEVIPCCVDLNRFKKNCFSENGRLRKTENLQDDFIFAYLGKIGKHYMLKEMLDFFKESLKILPNAKFMFITQNNSQTILDTASDRRLGSDKIIIKSPVLKEIPFLISLAHAGIFFINPYKKFGSSPIKLGEFLSCGIPVVINSGIGDTAELVNTNKVGVVVTRFEHDDYSSGLSGILKLVSEGDMLNRRCRNTAEKYLSLESGVKKYASIYKNMRIGEPV